MLKNVIGIADYLNDCDSWYLDQYPDLKETLEQAKEMIGDK